MSGGDWDTHSWNDHSDRFWSTEQVADYLGLDVREVMRIPNHGPNGIERFGYSRHSVWSPDGVRAWKERRDRERAADEVMDETEHLDWGQMTTDAEALRMERLEDVNDGGPVRTVLENAVETAWHGVFDHDAVTAMSAVDTAISVLTTYRTRLERLEEAEVRAAMVAAGVEVDAEGGDSLDG